MIDIVARLREDADAWTGPEGQNDYNDTVVVEREAATEIERLRQVILDARRNGSVPEAYWLHAPQS